ncbi:hypothetical protein ACTMU2_32710 [Cupriavidus basilensis]
MLIRSDPAQLDFPGSAWGWIVASGIATSAGARPPGLRPPADTGHADRVAGGEVHPEV